MAGCWRGVDTRYSTSPEIQQRSNSLTDGNVTHGGWFCRDPSYAVNTLGGHKHAQSEKFLMFAPRAPIPCADLTKEQHQWFSPHLPPASFSASEPRGWFRPPRGPPHQPKHRRRARSPPRIQSSAIKATMSFVCSRPWLPAVSPSRVELTVNSPPVPRRRCATCNEQWDFASPAPSTNAPLDFSVSSPCRV